jgi:hypothetical protein
MPETLRLYLDQMFQVDVAQILREQGYDVIRASETVQDRADDQQILQNAIAENRILITLDEHFGDWVILPLKRQPGGMRRTHAFILTLSYSRLPYVEFVFDQGQVTWVKCHMHAFVFFGGIPERIVLDNLVILRPMLPRSKIFCLRPENYCRAFIVLPHVFMTFL